MGSAWRSMAPATTTPRRTATRRRIASVSSSCRAEFPYTSSPIDWAFLRHMQPEAAAQAAERITAEKARLVLRISRQLVPVNANYALYESWQQTSLGNNAAGRQAIQSVRDAGFPIPRAC
jgi:hypothetical protein